MNKYIYAILMMSILTLSIGNVLGQDLNAGKTVFDKNCASCHGTGGKALPISVLAVHPGDVIRKAVRNGSSSSTIMPKFDTNVISNTDLDNLVAYIASQNTGQTTPPTTVETSIGTQTTPPTTVETSIGTQTTPPTTVETSIGTVETPVSTTPATPKSPGFDIMLGATGILLIYRLKFR